MRRRRIARRRLGRKGNAAFRSGVGRRERNAVLAYHLEPDIPLIESLRAVADDQIAAALSSLDAADEDLEASVHDVRKRLKKLRALLRLVRPGLGGTYAEENKRLRDLGRGVSAIRDAQVLDATLGKLEAEDDDLLAPARDWTKARREAVLAETDVAARIETVAEALGKARKRAAKWDLDAAPDRALAGGLKKTYGRARARFIEAAAAPEPTLLHEWRKRVKYHWYHCRLLREGWPEAMKARIAAVDALGDDLGDEHDLTVFVAATRDAGGALSGPARCHAEALAVDRRQALRRRALARAPKLFVEKKGALARRLTGYWSLAAADARRREM